MTRTVGFGKHDHANCVETAIEAAENVCRDRSLQFTPVRRRTLEILLGAHKAMGAYEILPELAADGFGSQPPVAYRALEFLVRNGFVHKVERLNAYIACAHPGARHAPAFMICRACGIVDELPSRENAGELDNAARASGFSIESTVIEAEGLCPICSEKDAR